MHSDAFDLGILGRQHIERATEIKFDESSQTWDIWLPLDPPGFMLLRFGPTPDPAGLGFKTYEGARQVEVAWLNACRLEGVAPDSEAGLNALRFIRGRLFPMYV